ncbi:MAG: hypothetical protein L6R38_004836, partial [Xanthoria sp. 2 TBL-2021]
MIKIWDNKEDVTGKCEYQEPNVDHNKLNGCSKAKGNSLRPRGIRSSGYASRCSAPRKRGGQ